MERLFAIVGMWLPDAIALGDKLIPIELHCDCGVGFYGVPESTPISDLGDKPFFTFAMDMNSEGARHLVMALLMHLRFKFSTFLMTGMLGNPNAIPRDAQGNTHRMSPDDVPGWKERGLELMNPTEPPFRAPSFPTEQSGTIDEDIMDLEKWMNQQRGEQDGSQAE